MSLAPLNEELGAESASLPAACLALPALPWNRVWLRGHYTCTGCGRRIAFFAGPGWIHYEGHRRNVWATRPHVTLAPVIQLRPARADGVRPEAA